MSSGRGPVFSVNTSVRPSGLRDMYSAMYGPGVSRSGSPPRDGMEYRCGWPSMYERNTMRSLAAQCRFVPPCVLGTEPRSVSGLDQTRRAAPLATSATQMPHGVGRRANTESEGPPLPGRRTNAISRPLGDQRGLPSRAVEGAIHRIGVESFV